MINAGKTPGAGASGLNLPEPMLGRFENLRKRLLEVTAGKRVYYQPNPGNWGDGLIRAGTHRFFADAGISYTECKYKRLRKPRALRKPSWLRSVRRDESVLIYGGGGGMCRLWDISGYVTYLARHFSHTVILPTTFELQLNLQAGTLFCRDRFESCALTGGEFVDDMAFYLGRQAQTGGQGTGYFFRTDEESAGKMPLPDANRDLSRQHNYMYPPDDFFAALAPFSDIHTDRLHVAIASCLLGKDVTLYPGSYFKNAAVFKSSMQELFPGASLSV